MDISDHLPVFLIKKKTENLVSKVDIKCRSCANYNKQNFQDSIKENHKWVDFWDTEENKPNDMWEIIETIIKEAADAHCPLKNVKINEDTPNWLNRELLCEINNKDHLYKKAQKTGNQEDWDLFKQKKIEVKKLLATAKENYVKEKLDDLEGNPRKCWRTIKNISGLGKNKTGRNCTKLTDEAGISYKNLKAATFLKKTITSILARICQES